jgi:hypothetical protein
VPETNEVIRRIPIYAPLTEKLRAEVKTALRSLQEKAISLLEQFAQEQKDKGFHADRKGIQGTVPQDFTDRWVARLQDLTAEAQGITDGV